MAIIIKSHSKSLPIDAIISINQNTGSLLMGEKDMYERIIRDCEKSSLTWYMWYDKSFNIPYNGQNEIQIDFLLLCQEGAIIVEVKGGIIDIIEGCYYYNYKGILKEMKRSPFEQANHYKWALINNGVIDKNSVFVDYLCAFPHSKLNRTSNNLVDDLSYKLWNKTNQESDESFADFCLKVIRKDKRNRSVLSKQELENVIVSIAPSIEDHFKYSLTSINEVLSWLEIDNINIIEGLRRNQRILIEGGPGTGKTTMSKAYIKRHSGFKGLYLCWNSLLASKIKLDLAKERLESCSVKTYSKFFREIIDPEFNIEENYSKQYFRRNLQKVLTQNIRFDYDYIIIDEAQDVADKGIDILLNVLNDETKTCSRPCHSLVFYDIEQGYNSIVRNLHEVMNGIAEHSAFFVLDENRRVPTNKGIVEYANKLLKIDYCQDSFAAFVQSINEKDIPGLKINFYNNVRDVKKAIKEHAHILAQYSGTMSSTTLLIHSDLTFKEEIDDDSVLEIIAEMDSMLIHLSDKTIERQSKELLAFTTILKYKGLEDDNIILVLPFYKLKSSWDNFLFEIYVGMTRAIVNLDIIILKQEKYATR